MLIQRKRVFSLMLALLLSLTVQRPALAALDPSEADTVTVREWAAMLLCSSGTMRRPGGSDCLWRRIAGGWLSLSGVLAPDAALCRGALYESAFAAGDLPVYDWSLYPGGVPLSDYENCLRIGAELGLCPSGADPAGDRDTERGRCPAPRDPGPGPGGHGAAHALLALHPE